jgi:dUTP pyrophosphatase
MARAPYLNCYFLDINPPPHHTDIMIKVKIRVNPGAKLPEYKSKGSAGADVCAFLEKPITIKSGGIELIPTGLFIELPEGYEAQIRPRSGLAIKHGITLLNTPGTIDSDYRGEIRIITANFGPEPFEVTIGIITANFGTEPFEVTNGMRIAQMVFSRVYRGEFTVEKELNRTERNEGGFGHTGL